MTTRTRFHVSPRLRLWNLLTLVLFLALALVTACGDSAGTGDDGTMLDGDGSDGGDTGTDTPCPGALCNGVCCPAGETCQDGSCAPSSCAGTQCGASCCDSATELCEAGSCVTACTDGSAGCSGVCCTGGELCDTGTQACAGTCADGSAECNGECCDTGSTCEAGTCRVGCGMDQTRCGDTAATETCCDATEVCENGACALDCGTDARCGSAFNPICCAAGEVCENSQCQIDCSGTRCGPNNNLCCAGGDLCLFETCITPQGLCTDNFDCQLDEFCEPTVGWCIKTADDPNGCTYVPPVGQFQPEPQWHWSGSTAFPGYDQVMMTPVVINLSDDNGDATVDENDIPDVVFGTFADGGYNNAGVIRVASGDDGRELAASNARPFSVSSDLGAADVDFDGKAEIVVASTRNSSPKTLYALNLNDDGMGNFSLDVVQEVVLSAAVDGYGATTAAFADLDGDNVVEVITQYGITDTVGTWTQRCEPAVQWPHAAVADLDGDGLAEIIAAGSIWDDQCNVLAGGGGARGAIADLIPDAGTDDLVPEIIWVRPGVSDGTPNSPGTVELWNVRYDAMSNVWTQELVWATAIPMNQARIQSLYGWTCNGAQTHKSCNTGGGPPTIADFDKDGEPEIGLAARWYYIVLETNGSIRWADPNTIDYSSAVTGSSVFDFEGDGQAEAVYADETLLRIYDGAGTGTDMDGDGFNDPRVLYQQANPSGTLYEMPLIVDVDNDGNAEIVVAANNYGGRPGVTGVRVFRDPLDNWVRTRRVWNQHTYHVTNINEDGTVPLPEVANWTRAGLNNFRQNVQPGGLFNAPNLAVDAVAKNDVGCPTTMTLEVTVSNQGSLGVPAGVWVGIYAINLPAPDTRALLGHVQTGGVIPPGGSETVYLVWDFSGTLLPSGTTSTIMLPTEVEAIVDDPPMPPGMNGDHNECVETDNTLTGVPISACNVN